MEDAEKTESELSREELGERLKVAREYLGFTQEDIAQSLGVARSALSLMEAGRRRVDALELKKLAAIYRRPLGYFTGEVASEELDEDIKHLARRASRLAPEDREELARFAEFLYARRESGDR